MKTSAWVQVVTLAVMLGCQPQQAARHESSTAASVMEPALKTPRGASVADAPATVPTADASGNVPLAQVSSEQGTAAQPVALLADTDPDNDGEVAPPAEREGCLEELTRNQVQFTSADIPFSQQRGEVFTCGATQVVVYKGRPSSPKYNSAPRLTCRMALGLIQFEELAQKLAQKYFGAAVRRIEQGGTYSCRKMARFADLVSEHSYANAIDVRSFQLSNGRKISVKQHFGNLASAPTTPESGFLRELASSLYDDGVFSVVLTPYFDRLHHDHFHFDQARYRVNGTG